MKILIIANIKKFIIESSTTRLQFLNYLDTFDNICVAGPSTKYEYNDNINIVDLIKNVYNDENPDIIIHYMIKPKGIFGKILVKGLNKINIQKCLWIEDIFHVEDYIRIIKLYNFSILMLSINNQLYKNKYLRYNRQLKILEMNHYINTDIFCNKETEKIYDIVMYGLINKTYYPLRYKVNNILKKYKNKYKIKIIDHPGYNINKKKTKDIYINEDLANIINQSYICICTKSKCDFLLKKYIETAACNTIICGDIPSDYKDEFKDNIIEINVSMTERKIISILDKALSNKDELIKKGKIFGEYIRNKYSFNNGNEHFLNILESCK